MGRANGGMIVHLGVIVVAVALVAPNAYTKSAEITLRAGEPVTGGAHVRASSTSPPSRRRANVVRANVVLDDGKVYGPAITTYLRWASRSARRACAPT